MRLLLLRTPSLQWYVMLETGLITCETQKVVQNQADKGAVLAGNESASFGIQPQANQGCVFYEECRHKCTIRRERPTVRITYR